MTTMRDVARAAGVSPKTVSRVFNDDPHVTAETRERVQWAMKKLHYVPNMLARSFRTGSDAAVGVAVPDIADPFFAQMTGSIEVEMVKRGMAVVITSLGHDPEREQHTVEALLRRQISGLILATMSSDQSYLTSWRDRTPVVFVDRPPRGLSGTSVVENDLRGARDAVTHLVAHGHRRIAFIGVAAQLITTARRLEGYKAALRRHALPGDDALVCIDDTSADDAAAAVLRQLGGAGAATAVFSSNIPCTMALIIALQRARRSDVALIGFGDFPMAEALVPAVSVIDQDPAKVGRVAVERLFSAIDGTTPPAKATTVLSVKLLARGSGELPPPRGAALLLARESPPS
jgi:LacI family transcriptional regulator